MEDLKINLASSALQSATDVETDVAKILSEIKNELVVSDNAEGKTAELSLAGSNLNKLY